MEVTWSQTRVRRAQERIQRELQSLHDDLDGLFDIEISTSWISTATLDRPYAKVPEVRVTASLEAP